MAACRSLKGATKVILTLEDEHILERNEHGKLVGLKGVAARCRTSIERRMIK